MEEEIVNKVKKYVKEKMTNESTGHDWWHIKRVYDLAIRINENERKNEKEKTDRFVIEMIALLHDIFDKKFYDGDIRENLIKLLKKLNVIEKIDKEKLENIIFSIENISFNGGFSRVKISKEGEIVQDADRIDALGAIRNSKNICIQW